MFIEERHNEILNILSREGRVKARELQEMFQIGFDTARRDLRILEEKGLLKRTHGGAIPIVQVGTPQHQKNEFRENDYAIAQEAIKMIRSNDVVFLSGSTIGVLIAENLPSYSSVTIVTNSILIAEQLKMNKQIQTFMLGGLIDEKGETNNHFAVDMIRSMRFDLSFITSGSYSSDFGLSVQDSESIPIIRAVLECSRKNVGVFSHEYMDQTALLKVCLPDRFDAVITDWETIEEEITQIKDLGVEVVMADQHEVIYKKLRASGYKGWGGSMYETRMSGWDTDLKKLFQIIPMDSGRILEMGCGAGDVSIKLTQMGFELTGVDISQTAIEWAKTKAKDKNLQIDFLAKNVADEALLEGNRYDLVLDGTCLHCLFDDDRTAFYSNVKRLMKDQGYFFVSSVILSNPNAEIPQVSSVERCVLSEDQLEFEIHDAGFDKVTSWTTHHEKHGHYWGVFQLE
ncbi:MAG: methyltransferase domain-containing protein [Clostridiales bacterium]|nr:methyltransferase domain-containing protein [Clostridiales bacterium]